MPLPSSPASFQERERLAVYLALSPERKAALCGWSSSGTAATRVVPFVQLSQKSSAEPSRAWRKRLLDLEDGFAALRGRVDAVEERTGVVLGPSSQNCHASRLRRLEAYCGIAPSIS